MEIVYTPEDKAKGGAAKERTAATQNGSARDERWHLRKDGRRFFVLGVVNAMLDDEGKLRGFIKVARDIAKHTFRARIPCLDNPGKIKREDRKISHIL